MAEVEHVLWEGVSTMDIRNVSSPSVRDREVKGSGNGVSSQGIGIISADRTEISALGSEWRGRVRVLDEEIRSLQDRLSRAHLRQDGLVDMQNELLEYTGDNFSDVRGRVQTLSRNIRYNGEPVLSEFELRHENEVYDLAARIEIEKNRLSDEKSGLTRELKSAAVARENVVLTGAGTSLGSPEAFLDELRSYARELNRASFLDQSRIRDLLG
jgi:hypothetical protein